MPDPGPTIINFAEEATEVCKNSHPTLPASQTFALSHWVGKIKRGAGWSKHPASYLLPPSLPLQLCEAVGVVCLSRPSARGRRLMDAYSTKRIAITQGSQPTPPSPDLPRIRKAPRAPGPGLRSLGLPGWLGANSTRDKPGGGRGLSREKDLRSRASRLRGTESIVSAQDRADLQAFSKGRSPLPRGLSRAPGAPPPTSKRSCPRSWKPRRRRS